MKRQSNLVEGPRDLRAGEYYGDVQDRYQFRGGVLSEVVHTTSRCLPKHSHASSFFSVLLAGHYSERSGAQVTEYSPWTTVYHPAGIEHRDEIGPSGGRLFSVEVDETWIARIRDAGHRLPLAVFEQGSPSVLLAMRLYREYRSPDAFRELAVEGIVLEMLASAGRAIGSEDRRSPAWLGRTVDRLRSDFCDTITLDVLAEDVGVHPARLSRLFRKHEGCTIAEYVRRLRVEHACKLLLDSERPLVEVALASGFADQSHLTRAFRRTTGTTPGAWRRGTKA